MSGRITPAQRAALAVLGRGWTLEGLTARGHCRFRHGASGALLVAAPGSGCPRALRNIVTDARKAVREASQRRARA